MPISERIIKHSYEYGSKDIVSVEDSDESNIVNRQTFKSLVGCIGQLSDLVVQSNEIFCELVLLTSSTTTRLNSLSSRVSSLSATVDSLPNARPTYDIVIEEATVHRQFFQVPQTQQLSSKDTVSFSMQTTYDSDTIRKMPPFHVLDPYKDCLMGGSKISSISDRYSHPKFFFNQWCLVQEARMKRIEAEKTQQKADKKARKAKQTTVSATDDMRKSKKKESISWQDRYIVNGEAVNRASIAGVRNRSSLSGTPDKTGRDSLSSTPSSSVIKASPQSSSEKDDGKPTTPPSVAAVAAPTGGPKKGVTFEPPKVNNDPPPPPLEDLQSIAEYDRDSDDDSDFDDEVDYRADPKYNLKKPLLIDISGADKGVFVSPEPFTKMRTMSNATLRYSAVYEQHHVSSRVVKNTMINASTTAKPFPTVQTDDTDVRIRQQNKFQVEEEETRKSATAAVPASPPVKAPKPKPSSPPGPQAAAVAAVAEAAPSAAPAPVVKAPSPPTGARPPPPPPPAGAGAATRTSPSGSTPSPPVSPPSNMSGGDSSKVGTASSGTSAAAKLFSQSSESIETGSSKSQNSRDNDNEEDEEDSDVEEGESNKTNSADGSDQKVPTSSAAVAAAMSPPKFKKPPPPPPPKAHYLDSASPDGGSSRSAVSPSGTGLNGRSGSISEDNTSSEAPVVMAPITALAGPPPRPAAPPPPPPKNARLLVKSVRLGAGLLSAINNARTEDGSSVGGLTPPKPRPAVPPPPTAVSSTASSPASTTISPPRPAVPSFMEAIRSGSAQLKKVDLAENEKLREQNRRKSSIGGLGDASVSAILERRKYLEAESSDSDSDADEDDWK